jgi:hypothetical protein
VQFFNALNYLSGAKNDEALPGDFTVRAGISCIILPDLIE